MIIKRLKKSNFNATIALKLKIIDILNKCFFFLIFYKSFNKRHASFLLKLYNLERSSNNSFYLFQFSSTDNVCIYFQIL